MTAERRGTRSLAQLVPRITGRALGRRGAAVAGLISKWSDIVGPAIARASLPRKLTFPKGERSGGTLKIAVAGSLAVELQHLEPQVLERINGFLGYGAVRHLRLVQDMTVLPKHQRQAAAEEAATPPAEAENADALRTALARLKQAVEKGATGRSRRKGR